MLHIEMMPGKRSKVNYHPSRALVFDGAAADNPADDHGGRAGLPGFAGGVHSRVAFAAGQRLRGTLRRNSDVRDRSGSR